MAKNDSGRDDVRADGARGVGVLEGGGHDSAAVANMSEQLGIVPIQPGQPQGLERLALMNPTEFEARLATLKAGKDRLNRIKLELMEQDVDYGVVPGTKKPTLLKAGAQTLCSIYGIRMDYVPEITYGDGENSPDIRIVMRAEAHLGEITGPVVGVGYGSANSWETKYRYREGLRTCVKCGQVGTVIKGKQEFGGGWLCFAKKGGCGAKWPDGTAEIESQQVGRVDNDDPNDLENTLLKMAKKRAEVDATLAATASSGLFTQDIEEQKEREQRRPRPAAAPAGPGVDPMQMDLIRSVAKQRGYFYPKEAEDVPDDHRNLRNMLQSMFGVRSLQKITIEQGQKLVDAITGKEPTDPEGD